jgi:pyruvate-ferredoxin/flavodoxin oxidoreductase
MATAIKATLDTNEAVARVAYRASEVIAIYPITPASPMGEWADQWASRGEPNLWGSVPEVVEMQSEGGAAGAVHGALQAGALATTFTASQGLLLMLPNMYKIAGELTSAVFHIATRSLATHALSIFCDHSDIMAARGTGWAMLGANSPQEAQDMALIAHAATLEARVPFLHFFDGFRTSHEIAKIDELPLEFLRAMIDQELVQAHRRRALTPDKPFIRGTAQNPDVFFQAREAANSFYLAVPEIVRNAMEKLGALTGRHYRLFDYAGALDAERVIIIMGSGAETVQETVEHLAARGERVGVLKVRLYRPFSAKDFLAALPASTKAIAVLDRTKEPGALGEPLYLDVVAAVEESLASGLSILRERPKIIGGRFGLGSKEFTPAMAKAVLDELAKPKPKNHFSVGIDDDITKTSLAWDHNFSTEEKETFRAVFHGLGADGTVSANKNSIKIIGEETDLHVQGFFVYDSKKAGSATVSHLRFGPKPIRSAYLIERANFIGCHQWQFLERLDILERAEAGATLLLNAPYKPEHVWEKLPERVRGQIIDKRLKVYAIDAYAAATEAGLGGRINTVMQACFFAISGVLPRAQAMDAIEKAIRDTYGKLGPAIIEKNLEAVRLAQARLAEIKVPKDLAVPSGPRPGHHFPADAPEFVREVTALMIAGRGDELAVSAFPPDGTFPCGTSKWEKRAIAAEIPVWDPDVCIQCGKCVLVCPHSVIRGKIYEPDLLADAPEHFLSAPARWPEYQDKAYTLQVAPEDCTGCHLCVEVCPAKNKSQAGLKAINMRPMAPLREQERENWDFFLKLPEFDRGALDHRRVKDIQNLEPLFEFSGACAGCGETPYLSLLTRLFGDRSLVANATGCSSIYGGNLPATPWTCNAEGRGPAWSNSLFEDNAEFGLGMRICLDKQIEYARELLGRLSAEIGDQLVCELLDADQSTEAGIRLQRERVAALKSKLASASGGASPEARDLLELADKLVRKNVWIVGGDGWAYDIGYGGLDHVLASGRDVNILVLDTEVYSNTGGQASKATPRAATAKFASGGKRSAKKDLALMATSYGDVYIARVAMGGDDAHTVKAFLEAEAYPGPSIIIAYSHCVAHGYDLAQGMAQQKAAVQSGHWPLMRYNPALAEAGKNPFQLDSRAPSLPLQKYAYNEARYRALALAQPETARELMAQAQEDVKERWSLYERLAHQEPAAASEPASAKGDGASQKP